MKKQLKNNLRRLLLSLILNLFFFLTLFSQDPIGQPPGGGGQPPFEPPCVDNSIPYTSESGFGANQKIIIGGISNNDGFINWNAKSTSTYGSFKPNNILNGVAPLFQPSSNIWSAQIGMNNVLSRFRINVAPTNCSLTTIPWNIALSIDPNGNIGVGTDETFGYRFAVNGSFICKNDIRITTTGVTWPDYVFHTNYKLKPLLILEKEINELGHLPEVPSTIEIEEKGISITEMNVILLKKVEELTLYTISLQKQINQLKSEK